MFVLGEKVVYAGHGVAQISRIIEKKIAGSVTHFFELRFINKDMTILIPTHNLATSGVRRLSSPENIDAIFNLLSQPVEQSLHHDLTTNNWNKRNKEYQCRLRTGKLTEIVKIYKDLKHMATHKELSFGEKGLLNQTEALLVEEIAVVENICPEKAVEQLRSRIGGASPIAKRIYSTVTTV
jgi:CarD family transcriptional regulator